MPFNGVVVVTAAVRVRGVARARLRRTFVRYVAVVVAVAVVYRFLARAWAIRVSAALVVIVAVPLFGAVCGNAGFGWAAVVRGVVYYPFYQRDPFDGEVLRKRYVVVRHLKRTV